MSRGLLQETLVKVSDDSKALRTSLAELLDVQARITAGEAWRSAPNESRAALRQKCAAVATQTCRLTSGLDPVLAHHVVLPTAAVEWLPSPTPLPDLLGTRVSKPVADAHKRQREESDLTYPQTADSEVAEGTPEGERSAAVARRVRDFNQVCNAVRTLCDSLAEELDLARRRKKVRRGRSDAAAEDTALEPAPTYTLPVVPEPPASNHALLSAVMAGTGLRPTPPQPKAAAAVAQPTPPPPLGLAPGPLPESPSPAGLGLPMPMPGLGPLPLSPVHGMPTSPAFSFPVGSFPAAGGPPSPLPAFAAPAAPPGFPLHAPLPGLPLPGPPWAGGPGLGPYPNPGPAPYPYATSPTTSPFPGGQFFPPQGFPLPRYPGVPAP